MEHTFVIYGKPQVKKSVRTGKYGNFYNPSAEIMEQYGEQLLAQRHGKFTEPFTDGIRCEVHFYFPFPKSFSPKKCAEWEDRPYLNRWDNDNGMKLIADAAKGILYDDDKLLWDTRQIKRYSSRPRTEFIIIEDL